MEKKVNKLLSRQLKRYFGSLENIPENLAGFMQIISDTYDSFDDDTMLLQNSIEISSVELRAAYEKQRIDAENQKQTLAKIKEAILRLDRRKSDLTREKDHQGDSNYLIDVLIQHIKESKIIENKLRDLTKAVEQSPASVIITNLKGGIEYVNQRFTQVTGYTVDDVIGSTPRVLKSGEQPEEIYKELWATILSGKEWRGEFRNRKKDGTLFWESAIISPLYNEEGEVTHFLAVKEDITVQKTLEENLKKQTQFKDILMEVASGFINIPLDKLDDSINNALQKLGMFVHADRSYIFHYNHGNFTATNTHEWCAEGISHEMANLQDIPLGSMTEWFDRHMKGEPVYIPDSQAMPPGILKELVDQQGVRSIITVPMMNEEKCTGFVGFDYVTQHYFFSDAEQELLKLFSQSLANLQAKRSILQELIAAKEKAVESDRLKTHFINNISHEIRTPLNGILGFGDLMMEESLTREEKQYYHHILHQNSNRLQQTMTDILDIAELKAGTLRLNVLNADVDSILHQAVDEIKFSCSRKNILVTHEIPEPGLGNMLMTDDLIFRKILMHLLTNAEKFTNSGRISAGYSIEEDVAKFFVRDTGKGISKDKQDLIFEPFMQEDVSNTRGYEGNGLGLTIARGMAELLGGRLWVESKQGEGSTFFYTIPLNLTTGQKENLNGRTPQHQQPDNPVVLIVEDDESGAKLVEAIIQKAGFPTLHAWNGEEAVDFCRQYPEILLVLMDIKMPVMNGLEATALIRDFRPELPIIALTAHAQSGDRTRMLAAGCNDYLSKPLRKTDLLQILFRYSG